MEPIHSLPCSQEPTGNPCPDPNEVKFEVISVDLNKRKVKSLWLIKCCIMKICPLLTSASHHEDMGL